MSVADGDVAKFIDRYGDEKTIHKKKNGRLAVKRESTTPALALNRTVGRIIGGRIRERRVAAGMTLEELCIRSGLATMSPKARMWEIENSIRSEGVRLGTLYAIAAALECEVAALMPPLTEVLCAAKVENLTETRLAVGL